MQKRKRKRKRKQVEAVLFQYERKRKRKRNFKVQWKRKRKQKKILKTHWKRKSVELLKKQGSKVGWRTVYHLLGEDRSSVMEESQSWMVSHANGNYTMDLEWSGLALKDLAVEKYNYGGAGGGLDNQF